MKPWILLAFLGFTSSAFAGAPSPRLDALTTHYADRYNLEPEFLCAFIDVESNWDARAVSPSGAMGLMQIMPATAARFGARDPFDPEQNIAAGARYLTTLMWQFHGDMRLVAAAYNAGDLWVGRRQLGYRNGDVIRYVERIRRQYRLRKMNARNEVSR